MRPYEQLTEDEKLHLWINRQHSLTRFSNSAIEVGAVDVAWNGLRAASPNLKQLQELYQKLREEFGD